MLIERLNRHPRRAVVTAFLLLAVGSFLGWLVAFVLRPVNPCPIRTDGGVSCTIGIPQVSFWYWAVWVLGGVTAAIVLWVAYRWILSVAVGGHRQ